MSEFQTLCLMGLAIIAVVSVIFGGFVLVVKGFVLLDKRSKGRRTPALRIFAFVLGAIFLAATAAELYFLGRLHWVLPAAGVVCIGYAVLPD
jgi:hypothetical protein